MANECVIKISKFEIIKKPIRLGDSIGFIIPRKLLDIEKTYHLRIEEAQVDLAQEILVGKAKWNSKKK